MRKIQFNFHFSVLNTCTQLYLIELKKPLQYFAIMYKMNIELRKPDSSSWKISSKLTLAAGMTRGDLGDLGDPLGLD